MAWETLGACCGTFECSALSLLGNGYQDHLTTRCQKAIKLHVPFETVAAKSLVSNSKHAEMQESTCWDSSSLECLENTHGICVFIGASTQWLT